MSAAKFKTIYSEVFNTFHLKSKIVHIIVMGEKKLMYHQNYQDTFFVDHECFVARYKGKLADFCKTEQKIIFFVACPSSSVVLYFLWC